MHRVLFKNNTGLFFFWYTDAGTDSAENSFELFQAKKSIESAVTYGVALVSRIDEMTGLFCKRAL